MLQIHALRHALSVGYNVWSNYPVGFYYKDKYLCPKPLDMQALYTFDEGIAWGWVFIDEIDKWLDRQDWANMTSKIITQILTLIRHRQLSLGLSIQSLNWLNARGQFQVDAEISCRDAAYSPWGRINKLENGEVCNLIFKDHSGIYTGYTYDESGKLSFRDFRGRWLWNKYDTYYEFNPMDAKATYHIKKKEYEVDAETGEVTDLAYIKKLRSEQLDTDMCNISDLIWDLKGKGIDTIDRAEFRYMAKERGINIKDNKAFTTVLTNLNVGSASGGRKYNLLWADGERVSEGDNPSTPEKVLAD